MIIKSSVIIKNAYKAMEIVNHQHFEGCNSILITAPDLTFLGMSINQNLYKHDQGCPSGIALGIPNIKEDDSEKIAITFSEIREGVKYKQSCFISINSYYDFDENDKKIIAINITAPFMPMDINPIIIDNNENIILQRDEITFSTNNSDLYKNEFSDHQKITMGRKHTNLLLKFYLGHITKEELLQIIKK